MADQSNLDNEDFSFSLGGRSNIPETAVPDINVIIRWFDGYLENFHCSEVRFGSDLLFMRLSDGDNRHIPLRSVRWFSVDLESHGRNTKALTNTIL